ncbi:MAG TPA: indolepyruvate oxidoreductase subunit beta [Spirochaetales bacterium]|nr:indolepyruvate oxidoreductase subunit beta [Spirochaetales bacterium]MBP7264550.1 indolepyruvate oxidoreductase subunit beta [Spirochaetia bacterium]HPE35911.1 indolepyruvate oxidoreductase subunit beta [Spirochaetales bacterium]
MKYDIVLCGVGGQGGISVSVVIAKAAMAEGLRVKQSEVHGMSQRGGEVLANLRLSDTEPASPMIPRGAASLILSFEPLEALRYLPWLAADTGVVISAVTPIKNMPAYPDTDRVLAELKAMPRAVLLDADALAKEAGNVRAANIVLVGAASKLLPLKPDSLRQAIRDQFARKGEAVVEANLKAFEHGRNATI